MERRIREGCGRRPARVFPRARTRPHEHALAPGMHAVELERRKPRGARAETRPGSTTLRHGASPASHGRELQLLLLGRETTTGRRPAPESGRSNRSGVKCDSARRETLCEDLHGVRDDRRAGALNRGRGSRKAPNPRVALQNHGPPQTKSSRAHRLPHRGGRFFPVTLARLADDAPLQRRWAMLDHGSTARSGHRCWESWTAPQPKVVHLDQARSARAYLMGEHDCRTAFSGLRWGGGPEKLPRCSRGPGLVRTVR